MKILQIPDGEFPEPSRSASPVPAQAPAPDMERVDVLEDMTKAILGKLHAIEERIQALEENPKTEVQTKPSAPVTINADAMNKDLFDKMWKYLNNKAA